MKKTVFGGVIFAAACVTASAQAADMYGRPAPYSQPYTVMQPLSNSWAGPYVGGNLGYSWGDATNSPLSPGGISGGLQAGYNWQSGPLVLGIEADVQLSDANDRFAGWKFSNPWFGTARGRIGYAFNNLLIYGTGGLAFGNLRSDVAGLKQDRTTTGWAGGVGVEYALNQNWSAKVEYLYVDLSDRGFIFTGTRNGYEFNTLRVGVNYRF